MNIELILPNNENLRPRPEVAVEQVNATFLPDGQRVRVEVSVTPFREQPNLVIVLADGSGQRYASANAVAIMNFRLAFVLHLRGTSPAPADLLCRVALYYDDPASAQSVREVAVTRAAQDV